MREIIGAATRRVARPLSHRLTIACCDLYCIGSLTSLAGIVTYFSVYAAPGWSGILRCIFLLLCIVQLAGMLGSPREKRNYWLAYAYTFGKAGRTFSGFTVYPTDQSLHPGSHRFCLSMWPLMIMRVLIDGAMFLVFYAYTFGRASRRFFGFG